MNNMLKWNSFVNLGRKEKTRWQGFFNTLTTSTLDYTTNRVSIWKKNKANLWYYASPDKKYQTPIFLIYSLVNQPSILDLEPNSSLIRSFVHAGYDVYLLDFGIPGYEDKDITLDDYITKYIQRGVQKALSHSNADEITLMGFCLGGTLAAIYASIADEPISNLILTLTPIDFHQTEKFDEWLSAVANKELDLDPIINSIGIIPALFMKKGMRLLTSPVYFSRYLSLLNRAYDDQYVERWSRLNSWSKGHIPMSGAVLKQLMKMVEENSLINGDWWINEKEIKMSNIQSNLLAIGSKYDRLVPPNQIFPILDLVSSKDKQFHLVEGGHTSLSKNGKIPDYLDNWLSPRSKPI